MLAIITMPSAANFMTDVGAWASPLFTDMLPLAIYAVGTLLAFALVAWVVSIFGQIVAYFTHKS